jgi:hypothetical protein
MVEDLDKAARSETSGERGHGERTCSKALICEDFAPYFKDIVDDLLKCISPEQSLIMDESGVTPRPFQEKSEK